MTPNSSEITAGERKYANGQFIASKAGTEIIFHSGGWLGTSTCYERIPEKRFSAVVFCNDVSLNITDFTTKLRKLVL